MKERLRKTVGRWPDAALAAALIAIGIVELMLAGEEGVRATMPVQLPAVVVICGAVVAWRRRPLVAALVLSVGIGILSSAQEEPAATTEIVAIVLVAFGSGAGLPLRRALLALVLVYGGLLVHLVAIGTPEDALWIGVFIVPAWFFGRLMRERRTRIEELERLTEELERSREEQARLAVAAEQARIAREMHDIVAHAVSLMTIQAAGGERVAERDPARAREVFGVIREAGSEALGELRRMLGVLRGEGADGGVTDPQPSLADLDALVERARAAGLDARLTCSGERLSEVAPGHALAVYRVVQEALTNAAKHADGAAVDVSVAATDGTLAVDVCDDGRGGAVEPAAHGAGHGLIGMRERAAAYGGTLEAGPAESGGYEVRLRLPLSAREGSDPS